MWAAIKSSNQRHHHKHNMCTRRQLHCTIPIDLTAFPQYLFNCLHCKSIIWTINSPYTPVLLLWESCTNRPGCKCAANHKALKCFYASLRAIDPAISSTSFNATNLTITISGTKKRMTIYESISLITTWSGTHHGWYHIAKNRPLIPWGNA